MREATTTLDNNFEKIMMCLNCQRLLTSGSREFCGVSKALNMIRLPTLYIRQDRISCINHTFSNWKLNNVKPLKVECICGCVTLSPRGRGQAHTQCQCVWPRSVWSVDSPRCQSSTGDWWIVLFRLVLEFVCRHPAAMRDCFFFQQAPFVWSTLDSYSYF